MMKVYLWDVHCFLIVNKYLIYLNIKSKIILEGIKITHSVRKENNKTSINMLSY